jgi:hypothetical protein
MVGAISPHAGPTRLAALMHVVPRTVKYTSTI